MIVQINKALYPYARKCHAHNNYKNKSLPITDKDNYCGKYKNYELHPTNEKFLDICPNTTTSETDCKESSGMFFCKHSKSCIDKDKKCNGIVNCIYAEDEDWEECKTLFEFEETATIECYQTNRHEPYNFLIRATPCNGECKDENCNTNQIVLIVFIGLMFAGITIIVICVHFQTTKAFPSVVSDDPVIIDDEDVEARRNYKGNLLVKIKVIKYTYVLK